MNYLTGTHRINSIFNILIITIKSYLNNNVCSSKALPKAFHT